MLRTIGLHPGCLSSILGNLQGMCILFGEIIHFPEIDGKSCGPIFFLTRATGEDQGPLDGPMIQHLVNMLLEC